MYPATPLNSEWLSSNAARSYPLSDNTTETDITQSFVIPRNLLVDLTISIDLSAGAILEQEILPGGMHVSNISVFAHGLTLTVSHTNGAGTVPVFTLPVSLASHVPFSSYVIRGQGQFARSVCRITIGTLQDTLSYGGSFNFGPLDAMILPTLVRPSVGGIGGVYVINGNQASNLLTGDIHFVAGRNINIRVSVNPPGAPAVTAVIIDCVRTEGLENCNGEDSPGLPPPIRSINGVSPRTADGGFQLLGGICASVTSATGAGVANTLLLANPCSQPCCSELEIEEIQTDLNNLNIDARGMKNFMTRLETYLQALDDLKTAVQVSGLLGSADFEG